MISIFSGKAGKGLAAVALAGTAALSLAACGSSSDAAKNVRDPPRSVPRQAARSSR